MGKWLAIKKPASLPPMIILGDAASLLSVFIKDPQFQGQTKDKLATAAATRWVDTAVKDYFDHWLTSRSWRQQACSLNAIIETAEERHAPPGRKGNAT